jgi:hypothetical protein
MIATEDLRKVLDSVQAQIAAADHKAAALLTIAGVLIAFPAPSILIPATPSSVPLVSTFCATVSACAFVVSIFSALLVLFPKTKNKTDASSLIYFGDIAANTLAEYADAIDRADDPRVRGDLIAQIHINAEIARTKHSHFKLAVVALGTGIVFLVLAFIAIAFGAKGTP